LEPLLDMPAGNRLWFDVSGIAALQDGEMEKGQTALVKSQGLLALRQAGYTRESSVQFINSGDVSVLQPDLSAPAPGQQPVQHMLGQTPPGATAEPLPSSLPRLALPASSPGDGGNQTRPGPVASSARRMNGN